MISETGAGRIMVEQQRVDKCDFAVQHVFPKWSLAYQAQVVVADVKTAISNPWVSGSLGTFTTSK